MLNYFFNPYLMYLQQPPFWPPGMIPFWPPGIPPFGPPGMEPPDMPPFGPPGRPPQDPNSPPSSPPPPYTPEKSPYRVDPGSIRPCRYKYTYIWLKNGQEFWSYPVYIGRKSLSGYRWRRFRWVYFGTDLDNIDSFYCI